MASSAKPPCVPLLPATSWSRCAAPATSSLPARASLLSPAACLAQCFASTSAVHRYAIARGAAGQINRLAARRMPPSASHTFVGQHGLHLARVAQHELRAASSQARLSRPSERMPTPRRPRRRPKARARDRAPAHGGCRPVHGRRVGPTPAARRVRVRLRARLGRAHRSVAFSARSPRSPGARRRLLPAARAAHVRSRARRRRYLAPEVPAGGAGARRGHGPRHGVRSSARNCARGLLHSFRPAILKHAAAPRCAPLGRRPGFGRPPPRNTPPAGSSRCGAGLRAARSVTDRRAAFDRRGSAPLVGESEGKGTLARNVRLLGPKVRLGAQGEAEDQAPRVLLHRPALRWRRSRLLRGARMSARRGCTPSPSCVCVCVCVCVFVWCIQNEREREREAAAPRKKRAKEAPHKRRGTRRGQAEAKQRYKSVHHEARRVKAGKALSRAHSRAQDPTTGAGASAARRSGSR